MAVYITGDTHGRFERFNAFCEKHNTTKDDIMIILGDAGLNYYNGKKDIILKEKVSNLPLTFLCIHGNHEMRPTDIKTDTYKTRKFYGGSVWYEDNYPNILFAKDGEVFTFLTDTGVKECMVIGGAYSVDKYYRLSRGFAWFENEQPSDEIKAYVEKQLATRDKKIDIILSHTCPLKYEPVEVFLAQIDQSTVDKSTEEWLDKIEGVVNYSKWYCGHFHTYKTIDKMKFLYEDIEKLTACC